MPSSSSDRLERVAAGITDLRLKLMWLSIFRMVATTLMLAVLAVRLFASPPSELSGEDSFSFLLIGTVYVVSLVYAVWLRRGEARAAAAWVQLLGDVSWRQVSST